MSKVWLTTDEIPVVVHGKGDEGIVFLITKEGNSYSYQLKIC